MKKTIYWAVTAKCGHVGGLSKYIPITFYVEAKTKKEASDRVIEIPRVYFKYCVNPQHGVE